MTGRIKVLNQGRSGKVQYVEGWLKKNVCEFYFEFGGADVIATIWLPKDDSAWDAAYPWAAGRRMEIVREMAGQVRKKEAPQSTLKWEADRVHLVA
jgi:hypothetical protein